MIQSIIKRDGRVVLYDQNKIAVCLGIHLHLRAALFRGYYHIAHVEHIDHRQDLVRYTAYRSVRYKINP